MTKLKRYAFYIHSSIWSIVLAAGVFLTLSPIFFGYDGECGTRPDLIEGSSNCYVGSDMSGIAIFIGVPTILVAGLILLVTFLLHRKFAVARRI